jgi:ABC-2 type transport system ATP-binding protein
MDIPSGKVSGLVGRNGSGKTTAIKGLLGLIRPDGGEALVFGKPSSQLSPADREMIGTAFSDSGFSSFLYVRDAVSILRASYKNFDEKWFTEECARGGLAMNKKIKDLSTGMKARLRVLTALSHRAKLLILDEPTAGLDVVARNEILDMLRSYLAEDGERTMLISSHISTDLEGLCDDIYMLHDGRIVLHEDTDLILGEYAVLRLSEAAYEQIDRQYIISTVKESFGYSCLTNQKQFYAENYPEVVIESGSIDDLIIMTSKEA